MNIKIYGLKKPEAEKVEIEINKLLRGKPYANEYVVTSIKSSVRDRHRRKKPFLELIEIPDIDVISELKKLGMDIEVPHNLRYFIPTETEAPG